MTPSVAGRIVFHGTCHVEEMRSMPTYEYRCDSCGKRFSRVESIAVHGRRRVSCPKCKSAKVTQVFTAFYAKTVKKS